MKRRVIFAAVLALTLPAAALAQISVDEPVAGHPAGDYRRAAELFEAGSREQAVCLFYRGQYRFRVHLAARPELAPSGDPALFASLNEVVGRPLNEWAGGDPQTWAEAIACALDWARGNDDPFTPKAEFASEHARVVEGLAGLLDHVRNSADEIAAERAARGLPNRR